MMDFDLLTTGDLRIVNGDIVMIEGLDEVRQRVLFRMRTQLGEWDFDTTLGLDYFGEILKNDPDLALIQTRILTLVATTPGVLQVRDLDVSLDAPSRTMRVAYTFIVDPAFLTDAERANLGLEPLAGPSVSEAVVLDVDSGELNLLLEPAGPI